jgi:hypothetical protein
VRPSHEIWKVGCRAEEGKSSIVEVFTKVGLKHDSGEGVSPVLWAATLRTSIPSSETIRRSPHFSIEQHDIKRMVPAHWHSRLQALCRWVLCCALWLLEQKSHMNCAAAAGFVDSKEDYVRWGSAFFFFLSLLFPLSLFNGIRLP